MLQVYPRVIVSRDICTVKNLVYDSIDRVGVRVGMRTGVGVAERVRLMLKHAVCLIIHIIYRGLSCFSAQSTTTCAGARSLRNTRISIF